VDIYYQVFSPIFSLGGNKIALGRLTRDSMNNLALVDKNEGDGDISDLFHGDETQINNSLNPGPVFQPSFHSNKVIRITYHERY
jgi:hypothetical protein